MAIFITAIHKLKIILNFFFNLIISGSQNDTFPDKNPEVGIVTQKSNFVIRYSVTLLQKVTEVTVTPLLRYSVTRLLGYSVTRLLGYSVTRLLGYSVTRLLGYSVTRLLGYSVTRLLGYSVTRLLGYSVTRLLGYSVTRLLRYFYKIKSQKRRKGIDDAAATN